MTLTPLMPPEATARSIDELLRDVRNGKIRIPQFQRNFRWEQRHILDLFDSVYRGYPIGSLLFWDTDKAQGAAARFGPMVFNPAVGSAHLVIDGQQRLTTLAATLLRDKEPEAPGDEDFLVVFDLNEEKFIIPKPRDPRPPHWLPLNEVVDTIRYLEWLEGLPRNADRDRLVQAANRVARALRDYKVPVYIVRSDDEEELRRIFERLNNSGKALTKEDIFRAITGKREDLDTLQANLARLGFGELNKELLLDAIRVIVGAERGDAFESIRARAPGELSQNMDETGLALGRVIRFVQEDAKIPRIELLPYRGPLLVLARLFQLIPEPSSESRTTLSRWLWRGMCDGRHDMNPSQLHATLRKVTDHEVESVTALCAMFEEFRLPSFTVPRHDFRSKTTKLICNVLVALGPRHLETGKSIAVRDLIDHRGADAFEQIVPRRHVDDKAFEKSEIFRGTSNRILHPHLFEGLSILEVMRRTEIAPQVMASHAIDEAAATALRAEAYIDFLKHREAALTRHALAYFRERTGAP